MFSYHSGAIIQIFKVYSDRDAPSLHDTQIAISPRALVNTLRSLGRRSLTDSTPRILSLWARHDAGSLTYPSDKLTMSVVHDISRLFKTYGSGARIDHEGDGVYRISMNSSTGKGTHTRWVYTEEPKPRVADKKDVVVVGASDGLGTEEPAPATSRSSIRSCSNRSVSTITSRETVVRRETAQNSEEEEADEWEVHTPGSDATEIVDEQAEAERLLRLKTLRDEEPLPDLPWERIMMRIAQEPTLIIEDSSEDSWDF
ncbi:hypothetical protein NP233_g3220 [Leucocoprinus birnbaumii]|uniref:Uncharacterized protein n=1 Tax=Leucocoprinus birnbaumii TaxID=56174 RepID=A0AAD5VWZ2_9AGAR|nr:hypothetical protein NP233_g3220 [Leucocoprinus birnbaumii]